MKARRFTALLCAIAYAIVFSHCALPHDHHGHEQQKAEHHHHHFPHHSIEQLSATYILSASQNEALQMLLPVCAILQEPPIIWEPQAESEPLFYENAPPLPPDIVLGARGLRAPPAV